MKLKFLKSTFVLFVFLMTICLTFPFDSSKAQIKSQNDNWYKNLLEKNVAYQNYACEQKDKDLVKEFFRIRQPKEIIPICHNDCPIVKCRPVVPFPAVAKAVRVIGIVSVQY